jgi:ribosomal protein S18 acetylase RimI-like enzyme
MGDYRLTIETEPDPDAIQSLRSKLAAYNVAQMGGDDHHEEVFISLRDEDARLVGGVVAEFVWGMCEVDFLWVHDDLRGEGYGCKLLAQVEQEAVKRGCQNIFLDTFSFQAPGFYQKLGYEIVAEIADYPPGRSKVFLRKRL